jgi:hypothetical protein
MQSMGGFCASAANSLVVQREHWRCGHAGQANFDNTCGAVLGVFVPKLRRRYNDKVAHSNGLLPFGKVG